MSKSAGKSPRKIIILGALSAIAEAAARTWAAQGAHLMLAARDAKRLEAVAADLRLRGGTINILVADLATADAKRTLESMSAQLGGADVVLVAYGVLGDQKSAETDPQEAERILATDFTSAACWCLAAADMLERQGNGRLVVIGSVAGDRGRASNYVYGAAKGGLGILVQGIAHRLLAHTSARAVLLKPGFVDTPMTAHIGKKGPFWAKPDAIARRVVDAGRPEGRPRPIVYAPSYWRWIMLVIRLVPSGIFHRTRF